MGQPELDKPTKDVKGVIFGIQHFSIHDGTGIRSDVFLKGCPLRCMWCHNPEGLNPDPELWYFQSKCMGCGSCGFIFRRLNEVSDEPYEIKKHYADLCPYKALSIVGKLMTCDEVMDEVAEDRIFFTESHGGLTITGGEPMYQLDFTLSLLKEAKSRGISTAIETSGFATEENFNEVLPYVDEFLWDYKETDPKKHEAFTRVPNGRILNNLSLIYSKGASITLRCPIIPGLNDTDEHFKGIADMHKKFPLLKGIEIMPYHSMGISKAERLGTIEQQEYFVPGEEEKKAWKQKIVDFGGMVI